MSRFACFLTGTLLLSLCVTDGRAVSAEDVAGVPAATSEIKPDAAGIAFFEKKIRPVLVKHCYECHSEAAKKAEGGLLLDTRAGLHRGGDSGAAVVPGNIAESWLFDAVKYETFEMPPDGQLSKEIIADFRKWIEMGAPDPRDGAMAADLVKDSTPAVPTDLWSLQPVASPPLPEVKNDAWPQTPIDRFVLARLESAGLAPVSDAHRSTLLRRLTFDLTGLPPTPAEREAFLADDSPQALETVVDRLLASPRFGERWARHWLDVARYAESNGKSRDVLLPQAWRYRNYVIDAYNADMRYDRFIAEQLAGDLLEADSAEERDRLQIATGFLAIGSKPLSGGNLQMDIVDDQIDVVGQAMLGLTVACARCHDHKFDPIPTRDYYALAGIFRSTQTLYGGGLRRGKDSATRISQLVVLGPDAENRVAEITAHGKQLAEIEKERVALAKRVQQLAKKLPKNWQQIAQAAQAEKESNAATTDSSAADDDDESAGIPEAGDASDSQAADSDGKPAAKQKRGKGKAPAARILAQIETYQTSRQKLQELQQQKKSLEARKLPDLEFAIGVRDAGKVADSPIHIRGERSNLGKEVPRGFLSCFEVEDSPRPAADQSGRLQLARWLGHPENPLTPRVAANRIWMHLMGRGIVGTVDNFGANGETPTHPELLDHLAAQFVQDGWSTKALIRRIVLSRTYQLASTHDERNAAADPGNELYWRMSRRRLEAEPLRDAMLAVAGTLNIERPEASPVAVIGNGEVGRGINTNPLYERFPHRSVYLPILRGIIPEVLKVFDLPEPSNPKGQRDTTNVPSQSLFLMNSPFVIEQSEALAQRVLSDSTDRSERIKQAFLLCYGRPPVPRELETARTFFQQSPGESGELQQWTTFCQALLASAEFRFLN